MLKLCRVTKVKTLFLVLVYVFNLNLFDFFAAILEKGLLLPKMMKQIHNVFKNIFYVVFQKKNI